MQPLLLSQMNVSFTPQIQYKQKLWVCLRTLSIETVLLRSYLSCCSKTSWSQLTNMNRFVTSCVRRRLNTLASRQKQTCCIRYNTCKPSVLLCTLCIILYIRMICTYQTPPQKSKRTKNKLKYYLRTGDSHCQTQVPHTHHTKTITQ